jgi:hypothetical protein
MAMLKETAAGTKKKSMTAQPNGSSPRKISLRTSVAGSSHVAVTGDFTQWSREGVALQKGAGDEWIGVLELAPGEYQYRLVVDGQWCDDPKATARVQNPYGTSNCILKVQ